MSKPMTENENKYFEMPKWSVFIVENFGGGNRAIFEIKRATVNIDEMDEEWENGSQLVPCDQKTNEWFGGGQWYESIGFCLNGWEAGSVTIEFSDKNTEQKYKLIKENHLLDPDEMFEKIGLTCNETLLYFRFKKSNQMYDWDITEQFSKYLEETGEQS